jgi:hypothetical protein
MAPMSEKQTHRKLSGNVELGHFSTQSGRKEINRYNHVDLVIDICGLSDLALNSS